MIRDVVRAGSEIACDCMELEPLSPYSKCAVFLGFDVRGPSDGCKIWFQKAELKKDLTRSRSEQRSQNLTFFLMTTQQPPRARREMTEVEFRRSEAGRAAKAIAQIRPTIATRAGR